jgi:hypothetical protein
MLVRTGNGFQSFLEEIWSRTDRGNCTANMISFTDLRLCRYVDRWVTSRSLNSPHPCRAFYVKVARSVASPQKVVMNILFHKGIQERRDKL